MVKDREAWHAAVHGVTESDMTKWLNNNLGMYLCIDTPIYAHACIEQNMQLHKFLYVYSKSGPTVSR